jgi:hypothetical protein
MHGDLATKSVYLHGALRHRTDGGGGDADALERVLGTAPNSGQMTHLAPGARPALSIEMQADPRLR